MANGGWWLDSGNGLDSGQVLIGNSRTAKFKNGCTELPLPTIQLPSLLAPAPGPSCGGQGPVINQAMAALVLQFVHLLITGELEWMGAYLDLKAGTLSTVHAEPKTAARLLGVKENSLK
jgi:hypothetical protein